MVVTAFFHQINYEKRFLIESTVSHSKHTAAFSWHCMMLHAGPFARLFFSE